MKVRLFGLSLGGKLSFGYLLVATALLVFGGPLSDWVLLVFGFPLMWLAWVAHLCGADSLPPSVALPVLVTLWVGNACLWGHIGAALARRIERAEERPDVDTEKADRVPHHPA